MTAVDEIILRSAYDECGAFASGLSGTLFRGWILAPFPIRAVCFRWSDGTTAAAVCGTPRPDVAAQFPAEPQAQHSGFWSVHPNFENAARATVAISDVSGRWWEWSAPLGLGKMRAVRAREAGADSAAQWEAWHTAGLPPLERYVVGKWRTTLDEHRPLTVRLDIINKCNLRCVMCHHSDDATFKRPANRVSPDDFERWFATVHSGVPEVVLSCGDEPLMSPQFSEIARSITSRYPEVNVMFSTKAMLMDERFARTIVDSGVALVMMSIDGVLPETLEAVRKGSRFDRVIGNARRLAEVKERVGSLRPYLVHNFVMMNRNLAEAPAFVEMAQALGAHYVDFRLVVTSEYFFDGAELCEDRPGRFNFFRRLTLEAAQRVGLAIYMPPVFPGPEEPEAVRANMLRPDGDPGCLGCPIKSSHLPTTRHG